MVEIPIIFENEDYWVVNKPSGLVVNRAESVAGGTVQDWVENQRMGEMEEDDLFKKRSGIAHRLDKETSGCLIIAKHPAALREILRQFKAREVAKEYLALVHGRLAPLTGTIKLPLARSRFDRERFEVHYAGKIAETEWRVEEYFDKKDLTLVKLKPKTGRTHQIRVHLAHLGHPVYADERYLRRDFREEDRKHLGSHFLHAAKITFRGLQGETIVAEAPLPEDRERLLSWIR